MTRIPVSLALLGVLLAPPAVARDDADGRKVVRYTESRAAFPNPERGLYAPRMSDRMRGLDGLRGQGITLLLVEMDLRDFKDRDLTPEKLDELRRALASAREAGLKVVFRAAYGFTGRDYRADPEDMDRILGHIRQLGPVFSAERDALLAVQAGFLGPWGEWHGSNWGDPPSLDARRSVLFGLLEAVPSPIPIQIRRPMFIRDIFADEPPLSPETAFDGSPLARTGWHDDALLALPSDMGTYAQRGWDRDRELDWCAQHGRFTPFGGETVPRSAATPVEQVVGELEKLHATYLNSAYHRGTLQRWRESEYQGENALDHITRRLGYRLVADRLSYTPTASPGGTLEFELSLRNVGFASPQLPREAALVLHREGHSHRVPLDADPRRWAPESGLNTLRASVPLPADLPRGTYRLSLHLADPSPRLRDEPRFAIRLANDDIPFSEESGANLLAEDLEVR